MKRGIIPLLAGLSLSGVVCVVTLGQQSPGALAVGGTSGRLIERQGSAATDGPERLYVSAGASAERRVDPAVQAAVRRLVGSRTDRVYSHFDDRGALRFLGGFQSRLYSYPVEVAAREFLGEYRELLGVSQQSPLELTLQSITEFQGLQYVRLQQELQGIPVAGAELVLGLTGQNEVFQISSHYLAGAVPEGGWTITSQQALQSAQRAKAVVAREEAQVDRVWHAIPPGAKVLPVWRVRTPGRQPLGDWEYLVDARNGNVLQIDNLMRGAGEAFAYLTNPVKGGPVPQRVRLENLLAPGSLTGRFAKVGSGLFAFLGSDPPGTVRQLAEPDPNTGDFFFDVFDPRFAEVQLYHNMDRVHARFQALGYRGLDRPMEGVVWDALAMLQGPYYLPLEFQGRGGIFFGPMPPRFLDPPWDADLIYHEYTHAVVNSIVGSSQGTAFKALNEGYADYFSASFLDDPDVGEFAGRLLRSRFPYLRTLQNSNAFPRDFFDEEHQASLIWSGALWDVRSRLGGQRADGIVLGGLQGLTGKAEYFDAGLSTIVAADRLYGTSVGDQVLEVMLRRGIAGREGFSAFLARDLNPGVAATGQLEAAAPGGCVLGDLSQFRISVPSGATSLSVALSSQASLRLYVRFRRPVTITAGRADAEYSTDSGLSVGGSITSTSFPELQSGTYYLAIASCNAFPVLYGVAAGYLGAGSPVATGLSSGASATGSIPAGPFLNSRQFAIQVPSSATNVTVTVQGSADVDLYMSYGRRVSLNNQGLPEADAWAETASSSETISLTRFTQPDLQPGVYYIAVYNYDDKAPAGFSVTATVGTAQPEQTRVVPLVSGSMAQASVPAASGGLSVVSATQYSTQVPANATKLTIVANTNLNIDILVRRNAPVAIQSGRAMADHFFSPGPLQARLEITAASSPRLQAGTYYIAIANFSASPGNVSLTVTVETPAAVGPVIAAQNGVVNGASFQPGMASGTWMSILGTNLAATARIWRESDFVGTLLPTQLDGVRVNINGSPAYVYYISPTQINALAPGDSLEGPVAVEVVTPQGRGAPVTVQKQRFAPGFFMLDPEGRKYLAAVHADGTLLGKPGLFGTAVPTRPAKPGDVILLFGTGFGPTDPAAPEGQIVTQVGRLLSSVTMRIGGVVADVAFAGLVGAGLYQFNVIVPSLPDGDHAAVAEIGGFRSQATAFITVRTQ